MANENDSSVSSINNNDPLAVQSKDSRTTVESIEIRSDRSMTCYICFENIVATHKQFGLQSNCDHIFCFDCLSTWRRTVSFSIIKEIKIFFLMFYRVRCLIRI